MRNETIFDTESVSQVENYVLVVDDDPTLEKQIRKILLKIDPELKCVWLQESAQALNFLSRNLEAPRLYLLDVFLPGRVDGLGLLGTLENAQDQTPVVFMSSLSQTGFLKATRKRSFAPPFLEKPLHEGEARRLIKHALDKSKRS